jgi:hypothetical protein
MDTKKICFYRLVKSVFRGGGAFLALAAALVIFPMIAHGAEVGLAWDANTEPDLAGYKIYYGTASGSYSQSIDVGNTTQHTLTGLDEGVTYYLAATAYDTDNNESAYSVELVHTTAVSTHQITATAGANGSISPSGTLTVDPGSSRTFTITADSNYHIHNVLVDGISVGAVSTYTFSNVTQNHAITASFVLDNQSPIADAGPDQTTSEGVVVRLKGGNSFDSDGNIAAYSWTQISGTPVQLSNSDQIEANFNSPNVPLSGDTLTFQLVVTDNEGLQAVDTCAVYVTREEIVDSDGDGVPDEQDDFPYDDQEYLDTDGDGVGNNADSDDDNDGMPDTWELVYGLDPLVDDAADDPDGDQVSNIDEYNQGSEPNYNESNLEPDPPQLLAPADHEIVGLTPLLETGEFYDPNVDDVHSQSRWKIIRVDDEFCVLDVTSYSSLTSLRVPRLILEEDTDYFWQVQFIDDQGTASAWSEAGYFTTEFLEQDSDGNGILDHQEVDATIDLDEDGVMDRDQADIKAVATDSGDFKVGISIRDAENVDAIASIQSHTPEEADVIAATQDEPNFLAFGLIHFKLLVNQPGDEVVVTIYLSKPAYDDGTWYKYNPVNDEWLDYSDYTDFSDDRKLVYLRLKDGGIGDADGIENGVIVDPLALRTVSDHNSGGSDFFATDVAETLDPTGACFISSAAGRQSPSLTGELRGRELSLILILMMLAYIGRQISVKIRQHLRAGRKTSLMEGWRNSQG